MSNSPTVSDRLMLLLGQWFGTGLAPKAPGTVGSLGALPFFWLLKDLSTLYYWLITAAVSLIGIAVSQRCSEILGEKDPSSVVIDEVAGVLIALGLVVQGPYVVWAAAWLLFRLFDITKPGLIDRAQYWPPAGMGIMADDLLAGAVAGALSLGGMHLWALL